MLNNQRVFPIKNTTTAWERAKRAGCHQQFFRTESGDLPWNTTVGWGAGIPSWYIPIFEKGITFFVVYNILVLFFFY